jgi:hypothetical protein
LEVATDLALGGPRWPQVAVKGNCREERAFSWMDLLRNAKNYLKLDMVANTL